MEMLSRLFGPRRRKNQEEIAARAAQIIGHVLFDVGVDRFFNGTVQLDRQFRLRFYAAPPHASSETLVSIAVHELDEARMFRHHVAGTRLDSAAVGRHTPFLADGLMREMRARSPALRALPAARSSKAWPLVAG
ncbi:hypothetical protein [Massilia sp. H6]|uniref:hypothetical protein n=1 Tax=Massilia sp. H6 TaxID=2970464 RepID=UPI00216736A8|nr:hypothetical protein [Massilia sp. H6]UVW26849.1 hypothetical protein NRS07_09655 [Massilia sp. H6]